MSRRWRSIFSVLLAGALMAGLVPSAGAAPGKPNKPAVETSKSQVAASSSAEERLSSKAKVRGPGLENAEYVPNEVLVRFEANATATKKNSANGKAGAVSAKRLGKLVPGLTKVKLKQGVAVEDAIKTYERQPGVIYAEPNYIYRAAAVPNDTDFSQLWGLNNTGQTGGTPDADIDAPEAWNTTTGSSDVVIAVIDSGIDYNHPELAPNVWTNPGEIPDNGIDDDGNGYIDDVHGWDAANDDGDPMDDNSHGTHCAGTIGAAGNNASGITGVNWNVKIMGVKFLDHSGNGTADDAIEAFEYVASNPNVKIVSNSWGRHGGFSQTEQDTIAAINKLWVFASGNSNKNNDTYAYPHYPSSYNLPNILTVNASDHKDARASFSNYGATSTDVFAPGVDILSTIPGVRSFTPSVSSTLLTDSMTDLSNWTLGTEPGNASNPWTVSSAAYVSAPSSAANLSYVDGQWSHITLTSGMNLSAVADPLYINAKVRYDLEEGTGVDGDEGDWLEVWGYSTETNWVRLAGYTGSTQGQFEDVWIDAGALMGRTNVKFSFDLVSDDAASGAAGYQGAYVDDVRLVTASSSSVGTNNFNSSTGWGHEWWENNPWSISGTRYSSPSSSLGQTNHNGTGKYANDEWALVYDVNGVDPGAYDLVFMRYKLWMSTEQGYDFFAPVYNPGDDFYYAAQPMSGSSGGWIDRASRVIGRYGQGPVNFGFLFMSDESNTAEGVYVDDLDYRAVNGEWSTPDWSVSYDSYNGTSMATPHVAGVAGLLLAVNPALTPGQMKSAIMNSVDKKAALSGTCVTGGRVNANTALKAAKGTVKGSVKWNGRPIWGASVRVDSMPQAGTASNGTYSVFGVNAGSHKVTTWKSGYVTKTTYGVNTALGSVATVNTNLVARPVIYRSPTSSRLTYKRRRGVAKFKLSGTFKTADGKLFTGRRVYLQSSRTGTGGWKNTYALTTNSYGKATKSFKVKKASTRYYRWYIPTSGVNTAAYGAKQRVRVR